MAPLPDNNTKRVRVTYKVDDKQHVVLFRATAVADDAAILAATQDLFTAASGDMMATTILGVDVADQGSDIFLPIGLPATTTYGSGSGSDTQDATFMAWSGRSTGGRRIKLGLYGYKFLTAVGDFRKDLAPGSPAEAVWNVLQGGEGVFVAIDGQGVNWKPYVNFGMNAYWQRKLRRV